jgi:hypothetical protein
MRRLEIACALAAATSTAACVPAGCSKSEDGGVHVVVELSPGWKIDDEHLFDNIQVTARGGGKRSVVCLYPSREVQASVEAASDSKFACADQHLGAGLGPPDPAADWNLAAKPRTINFVFPADTDVEVEAWAGRGGITHLAHAKAAARAEPEFPAIKLQLGAGDADAKVPECGVCPYPFPIEGEKDRIGELCDSQVLVWDGGQDLGSVGRFRTRAVACVRDGGAFRILPHERPPPVPGAPDLGLVLGFRVQTGETLEKVKVRGRWARCASGDASDPACPVTTECTPPRTFLARGQFEGARDRKELSCLPQRAGRGEFGVSLDTPDADANKPTFLTVARELDSDGSCFLEVERVEWGPFSLQCADLDGS